jgi:4-amino-4-deoxy-L-arabinose transferase-like glycosyltransferase
MRSPVRVVSDWWNRLTPYEKVSLYLAGGITFATRLIFVIASLMHHPVAIEVDSYRYLAIANDPGWRTWFNLNDPAGYPILLGITFSTLQFYAGILFLQLILSTLTTLIIWDLGRSLLTAKWNRVSAVLLSLSPLPMFFSSQLMTETSFAFFFLLALLILVKFITSKGRLGWLIVGGLSLSYATLIRPSSIVTIRVIALVLIFLTLKRTISFRYAPIFILSSLVLLFSYGLGLKIRYDYFGISAKGPTTLSIYYGIPIMQSAGFSQAKIDSVIKALPTAEQYLDKSRPDHIDGDEFAKRHKALFLTLLAEHPIDVFKVHLLGVAQMLAWPPAGLFQLSRHFGMLPPDGNFKEMDFQAIFGPIVTFQFGKVTTILRDRLTETPLSLLLFWFATTVLWLLTLACAIFGTLVFLWDLLRSRISLKYWLVAAVLLSYVFLIPHVAAGSRFRMPIEPVLILIACYGVQWIAQRRAERRVKPLSA